MPVGRTKFFVGASLNDFSKIWDQSVLAILGKLGKKSPGPKRSEVGMSREAVVGTIFNFVILQLSPTPILAIF